jgi:CBS domain-containing protein
MPIKYSIIEIFTNEEARHKSKPLYKALVDYIQKRRIAARCIVMKGIEAYYEYGEFATQDLLEISYNMPIKIEILMPTSELDQIMPTVDVMVEEGIITVRELHLYGHKIRKYLIPRHLRVRDAMTPNPQIVQTNTPVDEVIKLLLSSIFTGVPVADQENRPVGVITQSDLIYKVKIPIKLSILPEREKYRLNAFLLKLSGRNAEEIMTKPAITIYQDKMLTDAIVMMIEREVKRLVVVDNSEKIVGILARMDIFHVISKESPDWNTFKKKKVILSKLQLVSEILRDDTFSVLPDTSLERVLNLININDLEAIAVIEKNGKLKGMIFEHDLLKVFSDYDISIWEYLSSKLSRHKKGTKFGVFTKKLQEKRASEIMKTDLITVFHDSGIDDALTLMTNKKLKRLPVIDNDGKFKGIISRESLLRASIRYGS